MVVVVLGGLGGTDEHGQTDPAIYPHPHTIVDTLHVTGKNIV